VPTAATIDLPQPSALSPAFEQECVQFFAEVVQAFGVPKSVGQIYGLLYASPEPLSFSAIMERLEISKGSVSQGLQLLRTLGAIHEAPADSPSGIANGESPMPSRQVRGMAYAPELGLRKLISGVLHEQVTPLAAMSAARLPRLRALAEAAGAEGEFYLDRVEQLDTWSKRLKTVLPLLSALLGPKPRSKK